MDTIEITTPQQVVIRYNLAAWWERWLAFTIDTIALIILYLIFNIFEASGAEVIGSLLLSFLLGYTLIFESLFQGRTPGKMLLGIKVVKLTGEKTTFMDYFMRWTFRILDLYVTLGALATTSLLTTDRKQRIGDVLADTVVIRYSKSKRMSIKRLSKLEELRDYQPKYPAIVAYSEEDMLVVKEVMERYRKFRTEGSVAAMKALLVKIAQDTGLKRPKNMKAEEFLKILIKDYVTLTR